MEEGIVVDDNTVFDSVEAGASGHLSAPSTHLYF
jgi:hypothetical protein